MVKDYDGVKIEYIDPLDDAKVSYHYPKPTNLPPILTDGGKGVRNRVQAHMHAMRVLQKDRYANDKVVFTGADESNLAIPMMRIGVTNVSRADVQQGSVRGLEVIGNNIVMRTSNSVKFIDGVQHTVFVQLANRTTDQIYCRAGADNYSIILSRMPLDDISVSNTVVVRATYELVAKTTTDYSSYIVTEKSPADNINNQLTALNYDNRFYQYDNDYKNGNVQVDDAIINQTNKVLTI